MTRGRIGRREVVVVRMMQHPPMSWAENIPATAPAMPPMPTTELTALRGTVSLTSVNRFAANPQCAEAAKGDHHNRDPQVPRQRRQEDRHHAQGRHQQRGLARRR